MAIASTEKKLIKNEVFDRASLICDSHALMKEHVKEEVDFIIFNLGYLPRADKTITTLVDSTLKAIEAGLDLLKLHGIMVVVIYPGHEEGYQEKKCSSGVCSEFRTTACRCNEDRFYQSKE